MEADNRQPLESGPADRAGPEAQGKPVYIIDDDRMVRRALSFALKASGFEARAFVSGRGFLDEIDLLDSGCVLLDLRMPGMDGIAVLDELGDRVRRFPVVMITGHGDLDIAVKAVKLGASDFLEKPFTEARLLEILETLFQTIPARA